MVQRFVVVLGLFAFLKAPAWGLPAAAGSALSLLALAASSPPVSPAAGSFLVTDLGTLGGASSSATSVNDLSQAAGSSLTPSGVEHAFIFTGGDMLDLGTPSTSSRALGINNRGHVVGNYLTAGQQAQHAFLYDGSRMIDLGTLGGLNSSATAVNDADEVTGYSFISVVGHSFVAGIVSLHAFFYSSGKMGDLGTLGGPNSSGASINAAGQVVGSSFTGANSEQHAFIYDDGKMHDLGTLGGMNSSGTAANALGQAAGSSFIAGDNAFHAFLCVNANAKMIDMGTLGGANSSAAGINALEQVVGTSDTASGGDHAFYWTDGAMWDLNTLIPTGSGWELQSADAISDGGEIVGSGVHSGQVHAFLLTPADGRALTLAEVTNANTAIDGIRGELRANTTLPLATLRQIDYMKSKLQAAEQQLTRGKRVVAMNLLRSFIAVGSTLTDQALSSPSKQQILDAAQAVLTQLSG